ncbi:hypothetical protein FK516_29415, partial [Klebsiella pneumoniae]|nr:hypothetical protein [Klebsiella pneumoniae]
MEGPFPLITWGKGYAYVFTGAVNKWIPVCIICRYFRTCLVDLPDTGRTATLCKTAAATSAE